MRARLEVRVRAGRLVSLALLAGLLLSSGLAQDVPPPPPPPAGQGDPKPGEAPRPPEGPVKPPEGPARPPEAAPAADEALLTRGVSAFPLEPGRRWHYQLEQSIEPTAGGEGTAERTVHTLDAYVIDPQQLGEVKVAVLEWKLDQELALREFFQVSKEGVSCVKRRQGYGERMKESAFAPAQLVAREGLAVGQEWRWEGKHNGVAGRQTFKVLAEEALETPAGTFQTLVLEVKYEGDDESRGATRRWLAAGVGIVKDESEVRTPAAVFRTEAVLTRFEGPKK